MAEIPEYLKEKVMKWRNLERDRPDHIVEPGPGQESVWDYPRPPRVEAVDKRIKVIFAGVTIADSEKTLRVLETASPPVYYIPPNDIQKHYLEPSEHSTLCEWKGISQHWHLKVGDQTARNAAWSYPEPWRGYEAIRDAIAFYPGRVDACYIDDQLVTPQPGRYYGGWITPEITGPIKGEPGTQGW